MLEAILQILHWAVPGGIGATVAWLLSRDVRAAHTAKEVHDTYREMYSDVSESLTKLREENEELYQAIVRLERVVRRANACRYWDTCPIRVELPEPPSFGTDRNSQRRQPHGTQHRIRDSGDRSSERSGRQCMPEGSADSDGEPP